MVFDKRLAGGNAVWHNHAAGVAVAINDYQQFALGPWRGLARRGKHESLVIRFGNANFLTVDDKKSFNCGRIAILMMNAHNLPPELDRVTQYLSQPSEPVKLKEFLGDGTDGAVWSTTRKTAVKAHKYERGYCNERDTYLRLAEFDVEQLEGFHVPKLRGYDDELLVVEMDLMQTPPYVIDFAKVRLNNSPEFSEETLADLEEQGRELFDDNWPAAKMVMAALESFLIFYLDPKPYNIVFPRK